MKIYQNQIQNAITSHICYHIGPNTIFSFVDYWDNHLACFTVFTLAPNPLCFHTTPTVVCLKCRSDHFTLLIKVTSTVFRMKSIFLPIALIPDHKFVTLQFFCSSLTVFFVVMPSQEQSQLNSLFPLVTITQSLFPKLHHVPTYTQMFTEPTFSEFRPCSTVTLSERSSLFTPLFTHISYYCRSFCDILFIFLVYCISICSFTYCLSSSLEHKLCKIRDITGLVPLYPKCLHSQCLEWYTAHSKCYTSILDELFKVVP